MRDGLLNVLIILVPVLGYLFLMTLPSYKRKYDYLLFGSLFGLASVLCMAYPIREVHAYLWDLRMLPLLTAVFFAGRRSGALALGMNIAYRIFLGMNFYYLISLAIVLIPAFVLTHKISGMRRANRITLFVASVSVATIAWATCLSILVHNQGLKLDDPISLFGPGILLSTVCSAVCTFMIEHIREFDRMRNAVAQLEKARAISELAASVAHEIRNPLQTARGFSQLINEGYNVEKTKEYTSFVIEELDRADNVISQFIGFAKPQPACSKVFSIQECLTRLQSLQETVGNLHGIAIQMSCKGDLRVLGDPSKFDRAILAIVTNAIEATAASGNASPIQVEAYRWGNSVVVRVEDKGIGMNEKELKRLGLPFYALNTAGTGMGLTAAFGIVQAMGGSLAFESEVGKGTVAFVTLPFAQAATPA